MNVWARQRERQEEGGSWGSRAEVLPSAVLELPVT